MSRPPQEATKNAPKLRDGAMKRGNTWSYVIGVKDPETGVSKPRWSAASRLRGGQGARDENRVKADRGEKIDHNRITVAADPATGSTAMRWRSSRVPCSTTAPGSGSTPRPIGYLPIQAVRPSTITSSTATADQRRPAGKPSPNRLSLTCTRRQEGLPRCRHRGRTHRQNPVERAKRRCAQAAEPAPSVRRPTPDVPGDCEAAPAVRFFHVAASTGAPGRAPQPAPD